jgi:hypothetical protein
MEERGKHEGGYKEGGKATPFKIVEPWRTRAGSLRMRLKHERNPLKMGRVVNTAGYREIDKLFSKRDRSDVEMEFERRNDWRGVG